MAPRVAVGTIITDRPYRDLKTGFRSLTETPETIYVLELSLDGVKPDSSYHRLKVKVAREGLDLHARRGYIVPKPDEHKI